MQLKDAHPGFACVLRGSEEGDLRHVAAMCKRTKKQINCWELGIDKGQNTVTAKIPAVHRS